MAKVNCHPLLIKNYFEEHRLQMPLLCLAR
jgi:hypothetical protein